ncbi:MAG: hypothetical protein IBJ00_06200 [Alphaproteobacteria bacterium]|nr:hypothetical protein [Alphaproteobacteria bacterium]
MSTINYMSTIKTMLFTISLLSGTGMPVFASDNQDDVGCSTSNPTPHMDFSISEASIRAAGAQALSKLPNLTLTDQWYNQSGDAGAEALSKMTSLTDLDLGDNKIGDTD